MYNLGYFQELLAQNVQSNLLDQVRVVCTGQKLCIWLGNNLFVTVLVGKQFGVGFG